MSSGECPLLIKEGYLDKRHPHTAYFNKRLVRLSAINIQWYEQDTEAESCLGFGLQRGVVSLGAVKHSIRSIEDPFIIEIHLIDRPALVFRAASTTIVREWMYALEVAARMNKGDRILSSGVSAVEEDLDPVTLSCVKLMTCAHKERESVLKPRWGHAINILLLPGESIHVVVSNNASCSIDYACISAMATETLYRGSEAERERDLANADTPQTLAFCVSPGAKNKRNIPSPSPYSYSFEWTSVLAVLVLASIFALLLWEPSSGSLDTVVSTVWKLAGTSALFTIFYLTLPSTRPQPAPLSVRITFTRHDYASPFISVASTPRAAHNSPSSSLKDFNNIDSPSLVNLESEVVPLRFINGCNGDMAEATRRWRATCAWRAEEAVDDVLSEPQPRFAAIRAHMSFYHAGRGKDGHSVYYVRPPDDRNHREMLSKGVTMRDLWRTWLFMTEYRWRELMPLETDRSITVIDIENIALGDVAGTKLEFLRKTVVAANAHYPERSHVILIVNVPFWFSVIWKLMQPLINEKTLQRTRILGKNDTLRGMLDFVDVSQIPVFYGGQLSYGDDLDSCRFLSPEAIALDAYVEAVNARCGGSGVPGEEEEMDRVPPQQ